MLKDLRHAARTLLHNKSWTAVVVLSLALGIGANTALFSAVNGLMLETVPVPNPDTLVRLKWAGKNDMVRNTSEYGSSRDDQGEGVTATFSYEMFKTLRGANQTLIDVAAGAPMGPANLIVDGGADFATTFGVSGNYFTLLQIRPHAGRLLQEADDNPQAPPVAVISYGLWQRRFAADPKITNRTVSLNNTVVTIVGVLPRDYTGIQRGVDVAPDITCPLSLDPMLGVGRMRLSQPTSYWLQIVGRLKPGVSAEQARVNFDGVFQRTARAGMDALLPSDCTRRAARMPAFAPELGHVFRVLTVGAAVRTELAVFAYQTRATLVRALR